MSDAVKTNRYVTVRAIDNDADYPDEYFVNVIPFNGENVKLGKHGYSHKRSARRAAIALAKKLDVSYRQDLEYTDTPHVFVSAGTVLG